MEWKVSGLSHVGLPTRDMEAGIEFYKQFGFEILVQKYNENGLNYTYMSNGGCVIGLPQRIDGKAAERPAQGAIDHLALACDDIEALYSYCVGKGYKILSPGIKSNGIWTPKTCRSFMIEAPDGVRLEFQQIDDQK